MEAMARTSLSGFPEWLPQGRIVEQAVLDALRRTFELHGFAGIETRAVEPLEELERKGETSKEVYLLERLQARRDAQASRRPARERQLGLHFDLTVPFARYVLEHAEDLAFPFKRYQIQKVWRGERPQEGRFREFTQADVDVVGRGELPFHFEVDLPLVMVEALRALPLPPLAVHVNNRKVIQGFCEGIGVGDVPGALRALDKLDKIGSRGVAAELGEVGATPEQARRLLDLAEIHGSDARAVQAAVRSLGVSTPLLERGLAELVAVLAGAAVRAPGAMVADLRIARGLDYYTGSVYETFVSGHEDLGSVCSGGRYDSLVRAGGRRYPGVGLSIGVSRLVSRMLTAPLVRATRAVPTAVLVALADEDARGEADRIAARLRARGIPSDVSPDAAKFGKQIRYADRRGIPFVWFPGDGGRSDSVKDIRSGEQVPAAPDAWEPPAADLHPRVVPVHGQEGSRASAHDAR